MKPMLFVKNALLFAPLALFAACQNTTESNESTSTEATEETSSITLTDVAKTEEFPDAALSLGNVTATPAGDSVKLTFTFNVQNYELKSQTSDETSQLCSNSDKGQHIHFIMDNQPYVALYEPKHETTVARNTEHDVLAFLSRSYHLSLKNKGAAILYHFSIDNEGKLKKLPEINTPMVFYSRPKGDYLGKDTESVLFDFYLWNTTLGNDHQLRMEINSGGRDTMIMVREWRPFFLKNLKMGNNSIRLTLVDSSGLEVNGPETTVSREFTLAKDEPMPR